MKWSAKGHKRSGSKKCLIVDGYNVIPLLNKRPLSHIQNLEFARTDLLERLSEYQSFSGEAVIVVFDAYQTAESFVETSYQKIDVYFTLKNETADEAIERLVYQLKDTYREITVATSDYAEQQVIFGNGALRISSVDLAARLKQAGEKIRQFVTSYDSTDKTAIRDAITEDVANILEKWRRQK